jgi:hypothetical protein
MLMDRTGLTNAELKSLEARGRLKYTKKNGAGWALYAESIVSELMSSAPRASGSGINMQSATLFDGIQAAKVFECLQDGKNIIAIVIEMKIHPEVVKAIVREYERNQGSVYLTHAALERLATTCGANFALDSEEAVCEVVEGAISAHRCVRCHKHEGQICVGCARRKPQREPRTTDEPSDHEAVTAGEDAVADP